MYERMPLRRKGAEIFDSGCKSRIKSAICSIRPTWKSPIVTELGTDTRCVDF